MSGTPDDTASGPHLDRSPGGDGPDRRWRVDVVGLVAGVVFVGLAVAFAVADLDRLEDQVRVVWPIALLGIGLGMLLGTRRRSDPTEGAGA